MSKNKRRFTQTYLYRFLIITIAFVMVITPLATVFASNNDIHAVVKWIIAGILIALYIGALVYSYIAWRKKYLN